MALFIMFILHLLLEVGAGSPVQLCHNDEREALLSFKMGFTINNVTYNWGFSHCHRPYPKTESWKNGECCHWDGVTCDPSSGHVVELDLSCSLLTGTFPSNTTLFRLRRLRRLNLTSNYISSQIPQEIGWLSGLTALDLSLNYDATIANLKTILANLTDLRKLDLSYMRITSNLPLVTANLSNLAYLGLEWCHLQGEFPAATILTLPKLRVLLLQANHDTYADFSTVQYWRSPLEVLDFSFCNFTGKLPNSIGVSANSSLKYIDISGCNFYGDIPSWMWKVSKEIHASSNSFSGSLPTNVNTTTLVGLSHIDLQHNMITGVIPAWSFALPSLNLLSLSFNNFTGIAQFENANDSTFSTFLVEFYAYSNQLQGQIPKVIFELHNLQYLDLSNNNLTGLILLSKLLNLQNLLILSLSDNSLSIIDDMGATSTSFLPSLKSLSLSNCNIGQFPGFLKYQVNLIFLELSSNGIHGMVPEWFLGTGRTSLTILDLSNNSLTGGLDHLPWQNLGHIDISFNMFQGALPTPSPTTHVFVASNNMFTGEIPPSLCNIVGLEILVLSENNLTGNIPHCFFNQISQQLEELFLGQNQLHGGIPNLFFQGCPMLEALSLGSNLLEGPIPKSLTNCSGLQFLDLASNNLNDTFPHWLNVLPYLQVLILGSNNLQGSLMSLNTTKSFQKLRILDISHNDFIGDLPISLVKSMKEAIVEVNGPYTDIDGYHDLIKVWIKGTSRRLDRILDALVVIDASWNRLEGPIPKAIGDLVSMRELNLAHNSFSGNIPPSLAKLSLLESLDLSFNKLDGEIPEQLVNLNSLEFFNVSENKLVGPVPSTKQFDTFSDNSYIGNPGLCGKFLTKKCKKEGKPPSTPTQGNDSSSSGFHMWEIVLMGFGCGLFMGSAWGYFFFWEGNYYWVEKLIFKMETLMVLYRRRRRQTRRP